MDHPFDRDWTAAALLRFALPTVVMMVFMGVYTLTDTLFAARLVNTDALSAINIVCPVLNVTVGLGTMLAAGGGALTARRMGEGRRREANEALTLLVLSSLVLGLALSLACALSLEGLTALLGGRGVLAPYCRDYLRTLLPFLPANLLQTLFAALLVTDGCPGLGFALSAAGGLGNIALDWLLMGPCRLGIRGAALGTGLGYLIPALGGLLHFARRRGLLAFTRPRWDGPALRESCLNGSSELVGQLSSALTTYLFNAAMLRLAGEDGVAAITILIYTQFLLNTLILGFSMGVSPVISFLQGSGQGRRQRRTVGICLAAVALLSLTAFAAARLLGPALAGLFAAGAPAVRTLAEEGFALFSPSFLFSGVNLFTSALFTALSDGRTSALLSLLRTFGLLTGALLLLPRLWGIAGVFLATPLAEAAMALLSAGCLLRYCVSKK